MSTSILNLQQFDKYIYICVKETFFNNVILNNENMFEGTPYRVAGSLSKSKYCDGIMPSIFDYTNYYYLSSSGHSKLVITNKRSKIKYISLL